MSREAAQAMMLYLNGLTPWRGYWIARDGRAYYPHSMTYTGCRQFLLDEDEYRIAAARFCTR